MKTLPTGFTLLEVLIATIVITIGLLGLASTIGLSATLAGHGRFQSRAALLLQSRADLMRQELSAGPGGCTVPAAGSRAHSPTVVESWSASESGGIFEFIIRVGADTLITRVACP